MSRLWPVAEAAQADYETLRTAALAATSLLGPSAARFESAGLFGLIRRPVAEPAFAAQLFGARRAPWTPYGDPRLDALGAAYELILTAAETSDD
jgi:hypothetical protein